ncbi:hypothetical protein XENOCAPTIV_022632, partial [Xenoophorus captivus]
MDEREDAMFKTTGSKWLLPVSGYLGLSLDQTFIHVQNQNRSWPVSITTHTYLAPYRRLTLQVNFLACQLFALVAAFWFRLYLSHASSIVRHAVATLLGLFFLFFCFGWYCIILYSAHILAVVAVNYSFIIKADLNNVHRQVDLVRLDQSLPETINNYRYSMVTAMGYLTACHVSRVFIFNYGIL